MLILGEEPRVELMMDVDWAVGDGCGAGEWVGVSAVGEGA